MGPAIGHDPDRILQTRKGSLPPPDRRTGSSPIERPRASAFPDWYVFEGSKIEIARQIGNAVPPLLGKAIAEYVYRQ